MNDSSREYLNGNGNGNGNGHGKIFDLAPKQDPLLSQIVPAVRRKVCLNTSITEAARMFFCYLTDMSLLPGVNTRKGVVKFSDRDLAHRFKVNAKTIRNWKRAIESTGEVWLTEKHMKNSFPQSVYNISAIVGQPMLPMNVESEDGSLPDDEVWSSNRRRMRSTPHESLSGKFCCRLHGKSNCSICKSHRTPPRVPATIADQSESQKTEQNQASEKILPSTTANDCRAQRQIVAAHNGNPLPLPTANDCRPERQSFAAADGKILPTPTANGCRRERQSVADNKKTGDVSQRDPETSFKRSTGLNAGNGSGGAKKLTPENNFLMDVRDMMESWKKGSSQAELTGSGAWWRMSYRTNPSLMVRILAEVRCMIKEDKIKFNPGSAAVDLWTRWGGPKLQRQQKAAARTAAR